MIREKRRFFLNMNLTALVCLIALTDMDMYVIV